MCVQTHATSEFGICICLDGYILQKTDVSHKVMFRSYTNHIYTQCLYAIFLFILYFLVQNTCVPKSCTEKSSLQKIDIALTSLAVVLVIVLVVATLSFYGYLKRKQSSHLPTLEENNRTFSFQQVLNGEKKDNFSCEKN